MTSALWGVSHPVAMMEAVDKEYWKSPPQFCERSKLQPLASVLRTVPRHLLAGIIPSEQIGRGGLVRRSLGSGTGRGAGLPTGRGCRDNAPHRASRERHIVIEAIYIKCTGAFLNLRLVVTFEPVHGMLPAVPIEPLSSPSAYYLCPSKLYLQLSLQGENMRGTRETMLSASTI